MAELGVSFCPTGICYNNVSWGHTFRHGIEINSLSFFDRESNAKQNLQIALSHTKQLEPVLTVSGLNGIQITILSEGNPKQDEMTIRADIPDVFINNNLKKRVAGIVGFPLFSLG
jgi:hypothetical protein